MVQGPLVSSLGETVAVSTCTQYSMVRAEISCRNVNASRCHTALQHLDDSEVWSTIFVDLPFLMVINHEILVTFIGYFYWSYSKFNKQVLSLTFLQLGGF